MDDEPLAFFEFFYSESWTKVVIFFFDDFQNSLLKIIIIAKRLEKFAKKM
ncbi:hypothetical protein AGMMS49949_09850 [Alphaproteobacteria bacterium]|nr:hypothetical protein AGMMS49949_09850 [Alphaproteobacteria bacterium]GHT00807.1 hypothetical protein AGMMS50296_9120 [Alphaproteobacteria bacterium]